MKTVVVSGGESGVGKTTLCRDLIALLPDSRHVKLGHHAADPEKHNLYFPRLTPFRTIAKAATPCRFLIIESNTILRELSPDLCVYLPSPSPKPSAILAAEKAHLTRGRRVTRKALASLAGGLGVTIQTMTRIAEMAGAA
jgi:adenylate kinase